MLFYMHKYVLFELDCQGFIAAPVLAHLPAAVALAARQHPPEEKSDRVPNAANGLVVDSLPPQKSDRVPNAAEWFGGNS
jgi:hypothetical protein